MNRLRHINWLNTAFLILVPIIAITGTTLFAVFDFIHWPTWVLAGSFTIITGLSITAGYHRLFAHLSYKSPWPVRLFFALFGAATFEGSILEWCSDHRNHHRYVDTDRDPYNIKKGFWYAHIGWLFTLDPEKRNFNNVSDLLADPIICFQHKYYLSIAFLMGFVLPAAIAALWGDPWSGLIIAGALRMTFNHHFTFCINSVCHLWGKRTYSDAQSARDNWVTALFTYGEGFHNFHHQFPKDYRNGIRFYHFDPTKWFICGMSYVGLAFDLYKVRAHHILKYKIKMDEKHLMQQTIENAEAFIGHLGHISKFIYEKLMQVLAQLEELEKNYEQLKRIKVEYMAGKMQDYRMRLAQHRKHLKIVRKELKYFLSIWTRLVYSREHEEILTTQ